MTNYYEFTVSRFRVETGWEVRFTGGNAGSAPDDSLTRMIINHLDKDHRPECYTATGFYIRFWRDLGRYVLLRAENGERIDARTNAKITAKIPVIPARDSRDPDSFRACLELLTESGPADMPSELRPHISENFQEIRDRWNISEAWLAPVLDYWYSSFYQQNQPLVFCPPTDIHGTAAEMQLAVDLFTLGYWIAPVNCRYPYQCAWNVTDEQARGYSVHLTGKSENTIRIHLNQTYRYITRADWQKTFYDQLASAAAASGWSQRINQLYEGRVIRNFDAKSLYWNSRFYLMEHPELQLPLCRSLREFLEKSLQNWLNSQMSHTGLSASVRELRRLMIRDIFIQDTGHRDEIYQMYKQELETQSSWKDEEIQLLVSMIRSFPVDDMDDFLESYHANFPLFNRLLKLLTTGSAGQEERFFAGEARKISQWLPSGSLKEVRACYRQMCSVDEAKARSVLQTQCLDYLNRLTEAGDISGFCRLISGFSEWIPESDAAAGIRTLAKNQSIHRLADDIPAYEKLEQKFPAVFHEIKELLCRLFLEKGEQSPRGKEAGNELTAWLHRTGFSSGILQQVQNRCDEMNLAARDRFYRETSWHQIAEEADQDPEVLDSEWTAQLVRKLRTDENLPDTESVLTLIQAVTKHKDFFTEEEIGHLLRDLYAPLIDMKKDAYREQLELQVSLLVSAFRLAPESEERRNLIDAFWQGRSISELPLLSRYYEQIMKDHKIAFLIDPKADLPALKAFVLYHRIRRLSGHSPGLIQRLSSELTFSFHRQSPEYSIFRRKKFDTTYMDESEWTDFGIALIQIFHSKNTEKEERRQICHILNTLWSSPDLISMIREYADSQKLSQEKQIQLSVRLIRSYHVSLFSAEELFTSLIFSSLGASAVLILRLFITALLPAVIFGSGVSLLIAGINIFRLIRVGGSVPEILIQFLIPTVVLIFFLLISSFSIAAALLLAILLLLLTVILLFRTGEMRYGY